MTRSVADAALLYAAMAGRDGADAATSAAPAEPVPAAIALPDDALRGARLGVARAYFSGFDELDALIEQAIAALKRAGAEIVDPVDLAVPTYSDAELRVLLFELKASLPRYLATFAPGAKVRSLADAIAFNRAHREREMPWFGQELFEKAQAYGGLDSKEYLDSLAECRKGARDDGLDRVLRANRLDALIAPTGGPAWLIDPVNGDHSGASFSSPAAVAGLSASHGSGRVRSRLAGRTLVRRPGVERSAPARARPCLRKDRRESPAADVRAPDHARLSPRRRAETARPAGAGLVARLPTSAGDAGGRRSRRAPRP